MQIWLQAKFTGQEIWNTKFSQLEFEPMSSYV